MTLKRINFWVSCLVITLQLTLSVAPALALAEDGVEPVVEETTVVEVVEIASEQPTETPAEETVVEEVVEEVVTEEESTETVVEEVVEEVITEETSEETVETTTEEEVIEEVVEEVVTEEESTETVVEEVVEEVVTEETSEETVETTTEESAEASVEESSSASTPILTPAKEDYHPGETATIFGKLFQSLQNIVLKVFGSDDNNENYTETLFDVTADEAGEFSQDYVLDELYRPFYEVVAYSLEGDVIAQTFFRDAAVAIYDQCSNDDGDGYATGDTGCRFTNGNLQSNNSTYVEGDSTVQRMLINGFSPGSHTVTFTYGTTKGGHHAYDFLTTWSASENWITEADLCDGISNCIGTPDNTFQIPTDPNAAGFDVAADPRLMTAKGATITGISTPTIVSGTYAGDSETAITVTFTVPNSGPMCSTTQVQGQDVTSCSVAMFFGAHIAETTEWFAYNGTTGAGSIQGSPYHVALSALDGASVGKRDNQMQSNAIIVPLEGNIIIQKVTVGGNGSFNFNTDYGTDFQLSNGQSNDSGPLVAGTYSVSEDVPAGWALTSATCSDGSNPASIDLAAEETVTCTFTNSKLPTLTLNKVVVNDNGGTATQANFQAQVNGGNVAWGVAQTLQPGSYTASEIQNITGYAASAWSGDCAANGSITLAYGDAKTCSITNNDIAPTLTLVKTVVNNNGGSAVANDFQGKIDGNNVAWNVATAVNAGNHTASETTLPGYTASVWGGDCAANGSVSLALGENKTCTITNDDQQATITVVKNVINNNGGSAQPNDFNLTLEGNAVLSGVAVPVNPGTYTAGETLLAGYSFVGFSGDCDSNGDTTVALGEHKTCTLTNDDQQATITVVKNVINNNGGSAQSNEFNLTLEGNAVLSGVAVPVNPGTYTAGETLLPGYSFTGFSGDCDVNGDVTVALGQSKTCTLTNDDIAPTLKLVKEVTNDDGGSAVPADWDLTASGNGGFTDSGDSITFHTVLANEGYDLSESNVPGYTAGAWFCNGGSLVGETITLGLDEDVTCTISNNDQAAFITVIKHVINDNGGNAVAGDFDITINGLTVLGGSTFPGAEDPGIIKQVHPGNYNVTEDVVDGYADSYSADCTGSIALGESKTCIITNNDIAPTLTLIKQVNINHGGTAGPNNFGISIGGNGVLSGVTQEVDANTPYAINEAGLFGYEFVEITGDAKCPAVLGGTVTLDEGEDVTCTIVNQDIAPTLTLVKTVVNDNGGTLEEVDFQAYISGSPTDWDVANELNAGSYTASEDQQNGYTASVWGGDCAADGSVSLLVGENKTCTITNDDQPGTIKIIKNTIGGDGTFEFVVAGPSATSTAITTSGNSGDTGFITVDAGGYSIAELSQLGWDLTDSSCTSGTPEGFTLVNGGSVTCTFENTQRGKIIVEKVTIGGDGDFEFSASYDNDGFTLSNGGSNDSGLIIPGVYSVSETEPAGWVNTDITCSDGSSPEAINLAAGETVTCVFTNNKPAAQIDLTPLEAVNAINDDHVVTATVQVHNGDGSWAPAIDGTQVDFSLLNNSAGASFDGDSFCLTLAGQCSITINSGTTGNVDIHATTNPEVLGINVNATTGTGGENSADANKQYVNAKISIASTATNEVDDAHIFTVTVSQDTGSGFGGVAGVFPVVTFSPSDPGSVTDNCYLTGTDGSGVCTVEINSAVAGVFEASAAVSVNVNGVIFNLATDGSGDNSDTATKTYVDASISLTPQTDVNAVNDPHTIFVHVEKDPGTGPVNAVGETVTFTVTLGDATFVGGNTCLTDANGNCSVQINDATPGNNEVDAAVTINVGGLNLVRATNGDSGPNGSDEAAKQYVNAKIEIATSETNEVDDAHIFTVTVSQDTGSGFGGVAGVFPVVTFSPSDPGSVTDNCDLTGTNGSGQCTVTINSSSAGQFEASASVQVDVNGVIFNLATDGTGSNSQPAVKTYVDASIALDPLAAVNQVGDPHTITATVTKDPGTGVVPAAGVTVDFSVTTGDATFVGDVDSCVTDVNGQCSIQINDTTPGDNTINATTTFVVGGIALTRATNGDAGPDGSVPATKQYVNARISIGTTATNEVDDAHAFTVTVEQNTGADWVAFEGALVDISADPAPDSLDEAACNAGTDVNGQCVTTINSDNAGIFDVSASTTISVNGVEFVLATNDEGENSDVATKTYVDASIAIDPQSATNDVNDPHQFTATVTKDDGTGAVPAEGETVTFTITSGTASFVGGINTCVTDVNGKCSVSINDNTPGANTIDAEVTLTVDTIQLTRATDGDFGPDGSDSATKQYIAGRIIVQKVTVGGDGNFTFDTDYTADFQLANGGSNDSGYIPTGVHSVAEVVPAGWDLTSAVCDNGDAPSEITLADGDVVTCVFTNTKRSQITIVKDAQPNDAQNFQFSGTLGNFILDDDAGVQDAPDPNQYQNSQTFTNLVPNQAYVVTETQPNQFWKLQGITCSEGTQVVVDLVAGTATITPAPGQEVTCTFVNEKLSPTRTQGFWQTHTAFTSQMFATHFGVAGMQIGIAPHKGLITNIQANAQSQLFGAWYSNISKKTTGAQRTALDKARMQLLQQLVTAKLNCAAFGCSGTVSAMITAADIAYAGNSTIAILASAGLLDAYNNSGDSIIVGNTGKATPKTSQSWADKAFWNLP